MSGNPANNSNQAYNGKQPSRNYSSAAVQNAATTARQLPPRAPQQFTNQNIVNGSPTAYQPITLTTGRLAGYLSQRDAAKACWDSVGGPQYSQGSSASASTQQPASQRPATQQGVKPKASSQSLKGKPSGSNLRG